MTMNSNGYLGVTALSACGFDKGVNYCMNSTLMFIFIMTSKLFNFD